MFPTTPGFELKDVPGSLPNDSVPQDGDVSVVSKKVESILTDLHASLIVKDALWRDCMGMFATVRVVAGSDKIARLWKERNEVRQLMNFQVMPGGMAVRPMPGSSWVTIPFTFVTQQGGGLVGVVSGSASMILEDGDWRIWQLTTILEQFVGQPNPDGLVLRSGKSQHTSEQETQDVGVDYHVVIIGAGQQGLSLAGRLGALGLKYILFEKNSSIGENWTSRYDTMTQHTTKAMNYLPGDRTWTADEPEFLTAKDTARGYQRYVDNYGVNLKLRHSLEKADWEAARKIWRVTLLMKDTSETLIVSCRHLALAVGGSYTIPKMPDLDNKKAFAGSVMHSSEFTNAKAWKGKTGIVIGSSTSAHDVAQDMLDNGMASVTMVQRSATPVAPNAWSIPVYNGLWNEMIPTAISDRMGAGPLKTVTEMTRHVVLAIAQQNPQFWDGLEKAGFLVDREANLFNAAFVTMRSVYPDVGTSAHIISGDIKMVSGVEPASFTEKGIKMSDDREVDADLVVFATGYVKDYRVYAARFIDPSLVAECAEQFGLDEDGEIRGLYDQVRENLWSLAGAAPWARWNSRFIAMKLQADWLGVKLN